MTDTTNETQVEVTQDRASEIAREIMGEMLGIPASEVSADCTGAKLIRLGIYRFEDCHRIQAEKRNNALAGLPHPITGELIAGVGRGEVDAIGKAMDILAALEGDE